MNGWVIALRLLVAFFIYFGAFKIQDSLSEQIAILEKNTFIYFLCIYLKMFLFYIATLLLILLIYLQENICDKKSD